MNRADAERWKRMADALGIEVFAPFETRIGDHEVVFTALFPNFGAPKGMVVDADWKVLEPFAEALSEAGFGYSCVGPVPGTEFGTEMFEDWGWASPSPAPSWLGSTPQA